MRWQIILREAILLCSAQNHIKHSLYVSVVTNVSTHYLLYLFSNRTFLNCYQLRTSCESNDNTRGRDGDEIPTMLKNQLLADGVPADQIELVPDEQEATIRALEIAQPDDLVLVLGDNVKRTWKQIIYFNSEAHVEDSEKKPMAAIELPDVEGFSLDNTVEIISDERGVRIARDEESD